MGTQPIVVILGDSTSMTIGLDKEAYPFHLAAENRWAEGTVFINSAQPGMTSADAAAFFFNEALPRYTPAAVVCYLGNCDANATELNKGRYSLGRQYAQMLGRSLKRPYKPASLKNRLMRMEWNASWDPHVERPELPESFEANLDRILTACRSRGIPVVMVKPVANLLFPAGIGKGNFIFYSFLDAPDKVSDKLSVPDERFLEARRHEERGQWLEAMRVYKNILDKTSAKITSLEYPLIVVNNYAVCAAHAGRPDEAERLWTVLLSDRAVRREIILYNLACLCRSLGLAQKAEDYFAKAYDQDVSLYRIKKPYADVIDRLAIKFRGVMDVVDMASFAGPADFVDHCHLLPSGQRKLALLVKAVFDKKAILSGTVTAGLKNDLFNPELALGDRREFFLYYKTYAPFTTEDIARQLELLKDPEVHWETSGQDVDGVSMEVLRACRYYLGHPCFPNKKDIFVSPPSLSGDVGRFPELYLIRYLIPYCSYLEKDAGLLAIFRPYKGIWHSAENLRLGLPPVMADTPLSLRPCCADDGDKVQRMLTVVQQRLDCHLQEGPQVHERLRMTMFWYFREVLRWGGHSRISMRYDRRCLEYCMEALLVAAVMGRRLGVSQLPQIVELVERVGRIVAVHDKYCALIDLRKDNHQLLGQYSAELERLLVSKKAGHDA